MNLAYWVGLVPGAAVRCGSGRYHHAIAGRGTSGEGVRRRPDRVTPRYQVQLNWPCTGYLRLSHEAQARPFMTHRQPDRTNKNLILFSDPEKK